MKKQLLTILFCVAAILASNTRSAAQTLIHYWNFNAFTATVTLPAIASLPADYTLLSGSPVATLVYQPIPGTSSSFSDYCDPVTPSATAPDWDTVNARMGALSGNAFRARNPNDSMEILLFLPSTGYS